MRRSAQVVRKPCVPGDELARSGWRLRADGVDLPGRVRDGDVHTGWTVREEGKRSLQVVLGGVERLAAATLDVAAPWGALPPGVELSARGDVRGEWEPVAFADGTEERWEVLTAQIATPRSVRWTLRFDPRAVSALRLTAGSEGTLGPYGTWSIGELRLYRTCKATEGDERVVAWSLGGVPGGGELRPHD